jgi:urease accessory protein
MSRVTSVLAAGSYDAVSIADSVILDREQRRGGHAAFTTVGGLRVEFDPAGQAMLRMGDALVVEDGRLVEVVAEAEPLFEVRLSDVGELARLAWQFGDRHIAVQILPKRLRLARDAAAEALLRRLGVQPIAIEAPFEPEGGAYHVHSSHDNDHDGHDHGHDDHGHHHDHHHDHHAHEVKTMGAKKG